MANESENGQEKTEEPTPKRLDDARQKGQVPRSRELNATAVLLAGAGALLVFGGEMGQQLQAMMADHFRYDRAELFDKSAVMGNLKEAMVQAWTMLIPLLITVVAVAAISPVALGGFSISAQSLKPKGSKLNPLNGIKRMFGPQGAMELFKAVAKFFVIGGIALAIILALSDELVTLGQQPVTTALISGAQLFGWTFLAFAASFIVIAAVDIPFQLWNHTKQLRMTRQEVKDEQKETEGRPEVKRQMRSMQQEVSQRRMMAEVPTADVVVTNPTHFAVALRYEEGEMRAPKVVAKGVDFLATQIRGMAQEYEVPICRTPELARALYHSTRLDQEVPAGLYLAVAQVLAYVYQLKAAREGGWVPPAPPEPEVPDEFRAKG